MILVRHLSHAGLRIRCEAPEVAALDWLGEFIGRDFASVASISPAPADWTVRLAIDPAAYARAASAPVRGDAVAFVLDTGLSRLPLLDHPGPGLWAHDVELTACYRVQYQAGRGEVLVLAGSHRPRVRSALMRPVREWAMDAAQQRGGALLHAAACALGGQAVIIAGPKEAGKTSLLTYLLMSAGARFLANDRVLIAPAPAAPRVQGIPTVVSIRRGTLALFPELWRRIEQGGYRLHATLAECAEQAQPARPWADGRLGLTTAQYCAACGGDVLPSAPAGLILFPRRTGRPGGLRLEPLPAAQRLRRLAACRFGATAGGEVTDQARTELFRAPAPTMTAAPPAVAAHALAGLPGYDCLLGSDSFADGRGAEQISDVLRERPSD